jgi:hypothetical protein
MQAAAATCAIRVVIVDDHPMVRKGVPFTRRSPSAPPQRSSSELMGEVLKLTELQRCHRRAVQARTGSRARVWF